MDGFVASIIALNLKTLKTSLWVFESQCSSEFYMMSQQFISSVGPKIKRQH